MVAISLSYLLRHFLSLVVFGVCLSDNWSPWYLVQELIRRMFELTCGMLGILKLHRQTWVTPGDAEWGSRRQLRLTGVPSSSWLVRDWRSEEDSELRQLPREWEACIWIPVGLGCLTALWVSAMAVLVLPFQLKAPLYLVCAGTA